MAPQLSYGLNLVGLNNATSATGAALIGGIVLWNTVSAFAPWSATFTEENLRVGPGLVSMPHCSRPSVHQPVQAVTTGSMLRLVLQASTGMSQTLLQAPCSHKSCLVM
jgi:hypothetical protein